MVPHKGYFRLSLWHTLSILTLAYSLQRHGGFHFDKLTTKGALSAVYNILKVSTDTSEV